MKNSLKTIAKFVLCWLFSFLLVYLFVFFGGYKFFESNDVILKEIGVSFIIGVVLFFIIGLYADSRNRIDKLEKRIEELENQLLNK